MQQQTANQQASLERAMGLDLAAVNRSRFRLKEGESADIVVLDVNLDGVLHAEEHVMFDETLRTNVFEFCCGENSVCTLCKQAPKWSKSYTMFLTVVDLRGYTNRNTGVHYTHQKRLLALKNNVHPEMYAVVDACMREHGTIRGMHLLMARDGNINSTTGHPIVQDNGRTFQWYDEETLIAEFGNEEEKDEAGNVLRPQDIDITVFPYSQLFHQPSAQDLRARYGGEAPVGSREDVEASWRGAGYRAQQGGGAAATRMRSRTAVPGHNVPAEAELPPEQTTATMTTSAPIPPRTRTARAAPTATAQPAEAAPAPAPAPRVRQRVVAPPAATQAAPATRTIQRRAPQGGVPNDLQDEEGVPF